MVEGSVVEDTIKLLNKAPKQSTHVYQRLKKEPFIQLEIELQQKVSFVSINQGG